MTQPAPDVDGRTGIRLERRSRRRGDLLIGGSPLMFLRLSGRGAELVDRWNGGDPIGPQGAARRLATRLVDTGIALPFPQGLGPPADVVDVVIPVRDQAEGLAATVASLGPVGGVIVVDDGSLDPQATARAAGPTAHVVRHSAAQGPAAARNSGWRRGTRPLVAFIDADCRAAPGWLATLLPYFDDPRVGAVAPRITAVGQGRTPPTLAAYDNYHSPLDMGGRGGPIRPRSWVPYVPTACVVVRRSCLEQMDGFDEALLAGEDVDFVWRLAAAGWALHYDPAAEVAHPVRPSWQGWLAQRYSYGRSAAELEARHGEAVAPLEISGWSAAAWAAGTLIHPAVGVAVAVTKTAVFIRRNPGLPASELLRAAAGGHLREASALARIVTREWWPVALSVALTCPAARRPLTWAVVVPPLLGWARRRPPVDPARWCALRLADGVSYGAGVWAGCAKAGSGRALLPRRSVSAKPGNAKPANAGPS